MTTNTEPLSLELTDDPEVQNEVFTRVFNSGDGVAFDSLYRADAISNLTGTPLTGPERTAGVVELLKSGSKLSATLRNVVSTGDTRLLVVDFVLKVPAEDGGTASMTGVCTDVMVRGDDGKWIMAIDRPVMNS